MGYEEEAHDLCRDEVHHLYTCIFIETRTAWGTRLLFQVEQARHLFNTVTLFAPHNN